MYTKEDLVSIKNTLETWLVTEPGVLGLNIEERDGNYTICVYVLSNINEIEMNLKSRLPGIPILCEFAAICV